jgi:hypothetical protein
MTAYHTLWVYYELVEDNDEQMERWQGIVGAVGRVSPEANFGPEGNAMTWTYSRLPSLLARIVTNLLALPYVTRVSITRREK